MRRRTSDTVDPYRAQLDHCAESLAVAHDDEVSQYLPSDIPVELITMFTEGNLYKRFDKLSTQLQLLRDGFDDLDQHVQRYIKTVPLQAYDTAMTDGERFLIWLPRGQPLSPEKQDLIVCQRARHAVERRARRKRMAHLRFQELWSLSASLASEFADDTNVYVEINPVHQQAQFHTNVLLGDDDAELPATVVFFPVRDDVRTAVLETIGQQIVRTVHRYHAWNCDQLCQSIGQCRETVAEACHDLVDLGLAAYQ